ncbi:MAG: helix-turn-helix domain-containing protein [Bacteroidetes bacterium]|nr:helix-turn-helix domain-containing protein [Bacteroidota bacterium]
MEEQSISENIQRIRKKCGLTLTEVAQKAKITKSNLSKIENGHISTPISTLIRIAEVLTVPLSHFFTEPEENPPYILTRKGKGKIFAREGVQFGYSYQSLSLGMWNKKLEPFILTIPPEVKSDDRFQHESEEFVYMVSGRIEFILGDQILILESGDSLLFDSSIKHIGKSLDNKPATLLCVFLQSE